MDPMREIEDLVALEGRVAGSDAERRAAEHLAGRLRSLGRDAHVEPTSVWPRHALTHALHALIAITGSVLSVGTPVVGVLLLAFAALSTLGDLTGTVYLLRRITGRRASQNVTSREDGGKDWVLVLVAHYDAARAGSLFSHRAVERRAVLARQARLPLGIGGVFVIAIFVVLACAILRMLGIDSTLVSVVQFFPTVGLILSVPLLADAHLSPPVPAAGDNASGVATVLRLAERYDGDLENLDLWVVFTGAQESMALGMREWLRAHRWQLPRDATFVINVDRVAGGTVRFAAREGPVVPAKLDRGLVEICEEIAAEDDDHESRFGARRVIGRSPSDAVMARARGYRAITVSCLGSLDYHPNQHQPEDTPDRVEREALERGFEFCSELVERLDAGLGADVPEATSQAERR